MNDKNVLKNKIVNNTKYIEYSKKLYNEIEGIDNKINFIQYLITFMVRNVTTKMFDNFIEMKLNEISQELIFDLSTDYNKNTVLHVMTEAYGIGGHTKLLEQFVKNTKKMFEKQDIVITTYDSEIPISLENAVINTGTVFRFEELNNIEKATKLANLSSKYEYIILHIHPDDITANLAFGNNNFNRPIVFLNHADHMFWCGVTISNMVLDLTKEGSLFSSSFRSVNNTKVINIPIEEEKTKLTKRDAREFLNLPNDKKVILSIASEYKYGKTEEEINNFTSMALNIINKVENCIFMIIGPSKKNPYWNNAYISSNKKIIPLGIQERDLLKYYIVAADLYIESFPFASYTALLDTALYNINILSLITPTFTLDVIKDNNISCNSIEDLVTKSINILNGISLNPKKIDLSIHLKQKWTTNIILIFNSLEKNYNKFLSNEKSPNTDYLNHLDNIIGKDILLGKEFTVLPFMIKYKLAKGLIKFSILSNFKEIAKVIRKVVR